MQLSSMTTWDPNNRTDVLIIDASEQRRRNCFGRQSSPTKWVGAANAIGWSSNLSLQAALADEPGGNRVHFCMNPTTPPTWLWQCMTDKR